MEQCHYQDHTHIFSHKIPPDAFQNHLAGALPSLSNPVFESFIFSYSPSMTLGGCLHSYKHCLPFWLINFEGSEVWQWREIQVHVARVMIILIFSILKECFFMVISSGAQNYFKKHLKKSSWKRKTPKNRNEVITYLYISNLKEVPRTTTTFYTELNLKLLNIS